DAVLEAELHADRARTAASVVDATSVVLVISFRSPRPVNQPLYFARPVVPISRSSSHDRTPGSVDAFRAACPVTRRGAGLHSAMPTTLESDASRPRRGPGAEVRHGHDSSPRPTMRGGRVSRADVL